MFSIEAPVVRQILERADAAEHASRSSPDDGDLKTAVRLYCVASQFGSAEAFFRLGTMIHAGRGARQNEEMAHTLYSIAACSGHEAAALELERSGGGGERFNETLDLSAFCEASH